MKKILIIEDDVKLQKIYEERFSALGAEILLAATGNEGLSSVKTNKPDLVILDIMLPLGLNGFDVLEQMKRDPATKDIPVLVLTNLDSERKSAMDIGATDYIVKANTSLDDVTARVQKLLGA